MKTFYYLGLTILFILAIGGIVKGQTVSTRGFINQATNEKITTRVSAVGNTVTEIDVTGSQPGKYKITQQKVNYIILDKKGYWRVNFQGTTEAGHAVWVTALVKQKPIEDAKENVTAIVRQGWDWFIVDSDPLDSSDLPKFTYNGQ